MRKFNPSQIACSESIAICCFPMLVEFPFGGLIILSSATPFSPERSISLMKMPDFSLSSLIISMLNSTGFRTTSDTKENLIGRFRCPNVAPWRSNLDPLGSDGIGVIRNIRFYRRFFRVLVAYAGSAFPGRSLPVNSEKVSLLPTIFARAFKKRPASVSFRSLKRNACSSR